MTTSSDSTSATVLTIHHRYRFAGGEERAAAQLADLAEQELGEHVEWLRRDSAQITSGEAARGLLLGGTRPGQVTEALARTGADLVHTHNLFPTFGPAALRAAREAGAAVVVHLHNYRLICAVATNVRDGRDCTECSARRPLPGLVHRCRGSVPESFAYAAALPRWQRAVFELADVVIVPSQAARRRLTDLGLAVQADMIHVVGGVAPEIATESTASSGRYALLVTRLAPEKDLATAIDACQAAGLPLVIAGDGPEREHLEQYASTRPGHGPLDPAALLGPAALHAMEHPPVVRGGTVFVGRVDDAALRALRARASVGISTSVAHETFGLAALESMAAGLPTVGSAVGALPELIGKWLTTPPGDAAALAQRIGSVAGSNGDGMAAAARAKEHASSPIVAARLEAAYAAARDQLAARHSYR